jgi:hypothetical protein
VKSQDMNKRPGVFYAVTTDGVELPVVDVTHPAFALTLSSAEQQALVEKFLQQGVPFGFLPKPLRTRLLQFFLRGSVLAEGIQQAQGSYMSGLHTYLLKLGPEMLGSVSAKPIDRRIAESLPLLAVRLRLQDTAQLMADTLVGSLASDRSRPLHFVNIAGGPAIDSLNTLILLSKRQGGILEERPISIDVLDLDDAGPSFGEAALAALAQQDGPLRGLRVAFRHIRYHWAQVAELQRVLREAEARGPIVICSSEGGLFEYGSDEEIEANLRALRGSANVVGVVGSVTRADEPVQRLRESSSAATRPRGLAVFRELVRKAGWTIARAIERPFSDQVVLTR